MNERGLSDTAKSVWAGNVELDRKLENDNKTWNKEIDGTNVLKKEHDDVVRKYWETIDKFTKLLEHVAEEKHKVDVHIVETSQKQLAELSRRDLLTLKKAQSGQEVSHLTNTVSVYKKEMQELAGKFA